MDKWKKAAETLKNGGVVIVPSDSSYGIAALAENAEVVERVYKIKGREPGKPSLLIVGSIKQAHELVGFTPLAEKLALKYWPGGLTLVLDAKNKNLPQQIYGIGKTLAVRLPNKLQLRELTLDVGPIILPSANFSGGKPPFISAEVDEKLKNQVDFFLDEPTDGKPPSTIVDAGGENVVILRQGSIKVE